MGIMRKSLFSLILKSAAVWVGIAICGAHAVESIADAKAIAEEAYIFGYPLVTMEMTRRVMTNVSKPEANHAPMGEFYHSRTYPSASFRDVTAPNADTLYSTAWVDLSAEPFVLTIPDEAGRYFMMPLLDAWTTVFEAPGTRTTGTGAQSYLITGPGWSGNVPEGLKEYKSPTSIIWIIGRTYCNGTTEDYAAVHAIQDRYGLFPLSAYGTAYVPPAGTVDPSVDAKTAVRDQVNRLDAETYFRTLAALMEKNPPTAADAPLLARMATIGLRPGHPFELSALDAEAAKAVQEAPKTAFAKILAHRSEAGAQVNGWTFSLKTGVYGEDYLQRAFVTAIGLGANRPQDAVYPISESDTEGKDYDGLNRYVLHFEKDQIPPVQGFWSLTMYDSQYFFAANALNRFTVSPRNNLHYNADGSLDLYIQHDSPGVENESNWLPAPADKFVLIMRLYWPKDEVLNGHWQPPGVKIVGPRRGSATEG
ncbi:MAG: hypothetical protein JWL90_1947 [Chthoniobacteraceae bacterium]|nr:hypothetical protein [Chthoniobacteraceae bacterium]